MTRDEIREITQIVGDDRQYKHYIHRINKEFETSDEERNSRVYVLFSNDREEKVGFCVLSYSPAKMKAWERVFKEEGWVGNDFVIDEATCFELMYMYIKPKYRRIGYGDKLFRKAMSFCRDKGAREIYAYVGDKNDLALKFYRKKKAITIQDFSDEDSFSAFLKFKV